MSNEILINSTIQVKNGNLWYPATSGSLQADMANVGGPTPGSIVVATTSTGTKIEVAAELTQPGWIRLQNLDDTNFVEWGIFDSSFLPVGELLPGEHCIFRISRNYSAGGTRSMRARADTAYLKLRADCFDT